MLYFEGTISITPAMLRLISPFGESDGRCVHTLGCHIHKSMLLLITFKSTFIFIFINNPYLEFKL